ncbi:MAG: NAD(P)H-dependent oxidoreductase subunit E [Alphaproteobacteria bacterium]
MAKKINIKICTGTSCFVMGASNIQELETELPEELRNKVEIEYVRCLDFCKDGNYNKGPFVLIDGKVIDEATIHKIIEELKKML